jgi:hypothetical protein
MAPAGGGVSIRPAEALQENHLSMDESGQLAKKYDRITSEPVPDPWWWD